MMNVDAHEDLAWNMVTFGRDYTRSVAQTRAREAGTPIPDYVGEAMLGWPDWIQGGVGLVFATLYATPERYARPWLTSFYETNSSFTTVWWTTIPINFISLPPAQLWARAWPNGPRLHQSVGGLVWFCR